MPIQYTPAVALPYPQVTDTPQMASRDLRDLALKADSVFAQVKGESATALTTAQDAETTADAAMAHAARVEFPIESGTTPPADEDKLWVDEGATSTASPVTAADITDATSVGRNVLTAPLAADARNALAIFTGTRALLDEGTDTAERTWDAKELHDYVAANVTEPTTGWRNITHPALTAGKVQFLRTGSRVYMNWDAAVFGTLTGTQYLQQLIPDGFRTDVWIPFTTVALFGPALPCRLITATYGPGTVHVSGLTSGAILRAYLTWETSQAWPSDLPGAAA